MSDSQQSSTAILSSLARYADSDEEIGNTPQNLPNSPIIDNELETTADNVQATFGLLPENGDKLPDKGEIETSQNEIDEYSETASAMGKNENAPDGSQAGGEYNMLPSEFDSDEDMFSDDERAKEKASGNLVSYAAPGDEIDDEDEDHHKAAVSADEENKEDAVIEAPEAEIEDEEDVPLWLKGADLSEPNSFATLLNKVKPPKEEFVLPPLTKKKCSQELQERFERHHVAMKMGKDFIKLVESKTEYRNPSIYEKLVEHLHINEKGTNFPKHVFNPRGFPRTAYYDELARIQNELHAKKQQQKSNNSPQTSISTANATIISHTAAEKAVVDVKRPVGGGAEDTASRKTKWDMPPSGISSTQIPASGPLKKPKIDI